MTMDAKAKLKAKLDICRDVIANLHITAVMPGRYFNTDKLKIGSQDIIKKRDVNKIRKCGVCAKGALLMSRIDKYNKLRLSDLCAVYTKNYACCSNLAPFFSIKELDKIEQAFEGWGMPRQWKYDHPNPKDRLFAIMQNIIDHGEFRPLVRYDVK